MLADLGTNAEDAPAPCSPACSCFIFFVQLTKSCIAAFSASASACCIVFSLDSTSSIIFTLAIAAATKKVQSVATELFPADDSFHERAKAVEWRAQPHLLDEILWALYERDDKSEGEVDLEPEKAALVYLMLWAAIEALDANWVGPSAN